VQSISSVLVDRDLQVLLMIAQSAQERHRLEGYLTRQHVDGALLLSLHGADPLPAVLEERGVPTVRAGRPAYAESHCFVDADNRGGAREAVGYLWQQGRRRIATITGSLDMAPGIARLDGYRDVVGAGAVVIGDFSEESGVAGMRQLLDQHPDVDAVFAASDMMAAGALRVMRERGLRAPDDIAVIGFDDSVIARHTDPPLTTVYQPVEQMGQEMARLLLDRIAGEHPQDCAMVLSTRLIVRNSA